MYSQPAMLVFQGVTPHRGSLSNREGSEGKGCTERLPRKFRDLRTSNRFKCIVIDICKGTFFDISKHNLKLFFGVLG